MTEANIGRLPDPKKQAIQAIGARLFFLLLSHLVSPSVSCCLTPRSLTPSQEKTIDYHCPN